MAEVRTLGLPPACHFICLRQYTAPQKKAQFSYIFTITSKIITHSNNSTIDLSLKPVETDLYTSVLYNWSILAIKELRYSEVNFN